MNKEAKEYLRLRFKIMVLNYAQAIGNISKACRTFNVTKTSFYKWKRAFDEGGSEFTHFSSFWSKSATENSFTQSYSYKAIC